MSDILSQNNKRCGTTHTLTELSASSAAVAFVLMILTIPLNFVIIYCILKERQKKFKALFYKLLLNIALADLTMGVIGDTTWANFLIHEAEEKVVQKYETYFNHLSLFITGAVALITTIVLSIDRITAIVAPIRHYKGIKVRTENIIVFLTWPLGILLASPYFKIGYIQQLLVFTITNVVVCIIFLVITVVVYHNRIVKKNAKARQKRASHRQLTHTHKPADYAGTSDTAANNSVSEETKMDPTSEVADSNETKHTFTTLTDEVRKKAIAKQHIERRATKTFLITLCVFIVTYLPTCCTMMILNLCKTCNCTAIHAMRDWASISIRFSSVLRPVTFIYTLKRLRLAVFKLLGKELSTDGFSSGNW